MKKVVDVLGRFRAASRVMSAYGLKLREDKKCKQPYVDMSTGEVVTPPMNPYASEREVDIAQGMQYHECGHKAPELEDIMPMMEKYNIAYSSFMGKIVNVIEDYRNEINRYGEYPGRDHCLSVMQGDACEQGVEALNSGMSVDSELARFRDILGWGYFHRTKWQPHLVKPTFEYLEHCDQDYLDSISKYSTLLHDHMTAEDVYDLVCKLIDASPDHDLEKEKAKSAEAKASESKGESGEAGETGEGGASGEGTSDGSEPDGESGGSGSISYKDLMGHVHSGKRGDGSYIIIYDHKKGSYIPLKKERVRHATELRVQAVNRAMRQYYEEGRKLSAATRRLFNARMQILKQANRKTGRLNRRDLYRIPAGAKDVFYQNADAADPRGTAVYLLTDASGSMCDGSKFEVTAAAAALLSESLEQLHLPMEICAFTERSGHGLDHYMIKSFDQRATSDEILQRYSNVEPFCYQNADGDSLMWAYNQLKKRKEPRKILIVLSDGYPCADNPGDAYGYTKDVARTLEGEIELYGIGILCDSVKEIYADHVVLDSVSELESCLLNVIKTKMFN